MGSMRVALILCATGSLLASPVFDAIAKDDVADLKKALAANPDALDKTGQGGQCPLMNAVLTGKVQSVRFLLDAGADTEVAEQDGYTPMHGAAFQGRTEIAKMLVAHG